jgi:hypothetical protein
MPLIERYLKWWGYLSQTDNDILCHISDITPTTLGLV